MTDDQWIDQALKFRPHIEKGRAFGRHQPFVAIARVEIGAKLIEARAGMCPGAWAPSMTVQMPRARACGHNAVSIGNRSAVGDVMWLRNSTRVCSVISAKIASVNEASLTSGKGTRATLTTAPVRRAT